MTRLPQLETLAVDNNPLVLPPYHLCVGAENLSRILEHMNAVRRYTCPWCNRESPLQQTAHTSLAAMRQRVASEVLTCPECSRHVSIAGRWLPTVG